MLADKIKALCAQRWISLCALEKELGIGNGAIAKRKDRSPRVSNVKLAADYFGVTVDELLKQDSA